LTVAGGFYHKLIVMSISKLKFTSSVIGEPNENKVT